MRQSYKTFFLWAVLILLFISFYSIFSHGRTPDPKEIDASEFYANDKVPTGVIDVEVRTTQRLWFDRQHLDQRGHGNGQGEHDRAGSGLT